MNLDGLYDYQKPAALELKASLDQHNAALDGSDMGTGKTFLSGALIRHYNAPTLVVCPLISIAGWQEMGKILNTEFDCLNYEIIRTGNTPFGRWEYPLARGRQREGEWRCTSCQCVVSLNRPEQQPCPYHYLGIHCVKFKSKPHNFGKFFWDDAIRFLVFDEGHRCAGLGSLQERMLSAARRQNIKTVVASATIAESPIEMRALGFLLGLHGFSDFYGWARSHGCFLIPGMGLQWTTNAVKQREIMSRLHRRIYPALGTRIRISELDSFPEVSITADLYDTGANDGAVRLYQQMQEAVDSIREQSSDTQLAITSYIQADREIELLKVPIFLELTEEAIRAGKHVLLGVNYRKTVEELCKRLKTDCCILGDQKPEVRNANVAKFQSDESPVIIATMAAGAISITLSDVRGEFPRLGICSPGNSARILRQFFGRLPRAVSKSKSIYKMILLSGTPQEKVYKRLKGKLDCMDAINDGDLQTVENIPLKHFDTVND